ncbi:DUF3040 domain-containing protein [Corynebacterium uropygiale]|uniref:DUF3040 domain-containing protein n=1 Tax=Corynebacterium uropygiale TaxID=1775911 RepID=A0A9X1TXM6_9CORY|nr:DUF3040 domain-containing protein [Corynebacterium uropygiale]
MALSDEERRALREIEESLFADDPRFGASVSDVDDGGPSQGMVSARGIALVVLGLVLLLGGVALAQSNLWWVALSIVGFVLMLGAGIWMLRARRDGVPARVGAAASSPRRHSGGGSLSSKLEDNFRRRFDNN